ncbi:MAG: hypothetical protein E7644_01900 [Ruminococcaceae bacterium]|nr:hypothetical protein [Oscillospiraceae bacterium]
MLERYPSLYSYDIFPKVVPVGREVTVTVRVLDPHLMGELPYTVSLYAINGGGEAMVKDLPRTLLPAPQQGFTVTVTLPSEQEYQLHINYENKTRPRAALPFYAVEDDLLCRTPLVGDLHAHTFFSDGQQGPAFIAAEYRKNGYDFLSVTDHRRRAPSLMAIETFEELELPFKLYPGEEVHPHGIRTHIVNFASDNSANEYALAAKAQEEWRNTDPTPEWEAEMARIKETLTDLPDGVSADEVASAMIVCRIIREGGGLAILAHPHWVYPLRSVPDQTTRYFFEKGIFDALELIGGMRWYENHPQVALYHHLTAEGIRIPVVGSSDEHGVLPHDHPAKTVAYFTEERTLVFAKENSREEIIGAIKDLYSTAVLKYAEQYPQVCGGSYRLYQYAQFLLLNYFPLRDELYAAEGRLMLDYAAGVPGAKEKLLRTVQSHAYFEEKYFCR